LIPGLAWNQKVRHLLETEGSMIGMPFETWANMPLLQMVYFHETLAAFKTRTLLTEFQMAKFHLILGQSAASVPIVLVPLYQRVTVARGQYYQLRTFCRDLRHSIVS
jgi:hypothetical protein